MVIQRLNTRLHGECHARLQSRSRCPSVRPRPDRRCSPNMEIWIATAHEFCTHCEMGARTHGPTRRGGIPKPRASTFWPSRRRLLSIRPNMLRDLFLRVCKRRHLNGRPISTPLRECICVHTRRDDTHLHFHNVGLTFPCTCKRARTHTREQQTRTHYSYNKR